MFLKNHAKSKVFQNNRRQQAFFVKIWCRVGKLGYNSHKRTQSFRSFDQALTSPSGVQRRIYTTSAEREFQLMRNLLRNVLRNVLRNLLRNLRRKKACHRQYIFGLDGTWRNIKSVLQISLYFVSI